MEIGRKIKELRLTCQLTQEELADRCDLTKGYISQLENDLTSPSIASLIDILNALGVKPAEFFDDGEGDDVVFGLDAYFSKDYGDYGLTWLVPTAQKNVMEPVLLTLHPGGKTMRDLPHEGEEFGYILKGAVQITLGKRKFTARQGESFYYSAGSAHTLENLSDTDAAEILWLSSPPNF